ncbi:hypothetical protein Pcinc_038723 [Petrolisthes cinctipes]|uniref:C2H2-type domain-containing protein n=1 Tax=Petrolisthes cinctipes TaxID=88211 RepID=A0AAE1BSV1_PETCI|nr:hypothetical protein Pcinc_038723 [Petrolisthes cinctipes]
MMDDSTHLVAESGLFTFLQGGGWSDGTAALPVSQARLSGGYPGLPGGEGVVVEGGAGVFSVLSSVPPPPPPPPPPVNPSPHATTAWGAKLGGVEDNRNNVVGGQEVVVVGGGVDGGVGGRTSHNVTWTKRSVTSAVCAVCFKDFMYPSALTLHMRSHTGEKPFTCPHPQCDYRSTKKGNLKRHAFTHGEAFLATLEL